MKKVLTLISTLGLFSMIQAQTVSSVQNLEAIEEGQRDQAQMEYGSFTAQQVSILEMVRSQMSLATAASNTTAQTLEATATKLLQDVYDSNRASVKNGYTAIALGAIEGAVKAADGDQAKLSEGIAKAKSALFKGANTFADQNKMNKIVVARYYPAAFQNALEKNGQTADLAALKAEALKFGTEAGIDARVLSAFLNK